MRSIFWKTNRINCSGTMNFLTGETILKMGLLFLLGFILILPYFISIEQLPMPDCAFKKYTGYSCPTCGLTSSVYAISRGQFLQAVKHHFGGYFIYAGLLFLMLMQVLELIKPDRIGIQLRARWLKRGLLVIFAAWLVFGMIRFAIEIY